QIRVDDQHGIGVHTRREFTSRVPECLLVQAQVLARARRSCYRGAMEVRRLVTRACTVCEWEGQAVEQGDRPTAGCHWCHPPARTCSSGRPHCDVSTGMLLSDSMPPRLAPRLMTCSRS